MIHPDSRSIEWMRKVAGDNNYPDIILVEKAIRAFSLLESLVLSGCPFVFKGGTALMLHLDSMKRLSIDIDIVCPPGTIIEEFVHKHAWAYGFSEVKLVDRVSASNVPKSHAKFFYQPAYVTHSEVGSILLDVLFEDNQYQEIVQLPIQCSVLKMDGDPVKVNVPGRQDLLADKLTAFAPNTTGIPYFKGGKDCSMEIMKQLFDVASLFDVTYDLITVSRTFKKCAKIELKYRDFDPGNVAQVLEDIYRTSLCICLRGLIDPDNYKQLLNGSKRIQSFIHGEKYTVDSAIIHASKAAYLSVLIASEMTEVHHFDPNLIEPLRRALIQEPFLIKLNKLKKANIEAFYYWNEISKCITNLPGFVEIAHSCGG